jgi:AAA domain-containing protein
MPIQIVSAAEWQGVAASLPSIEMLLDPLVPSRGKTLLHGPPGSGKSALMWGIGNAVVTGTPYLKLPTKQRRVLLLSTDMSLYELKHRWGDSFVPLFDVLCAAGFNCTKPMFNKSEIYGTVRAYVESHDIQLVMVDALGGIHSGSSARDDEVADAVEEQLTKWLPNTAFLLLGHDRKLRFDFKGNASPPSPEDFLGSQKWSANATSQIHMSLTPNKFISVIEHVKCQVAAKHPSVIKVYIDAHGCAEAWDEHKATEAKSKFTKAINELGLVGMETSEQVKRIAAKYKKTERTVWRWRALWH